jgi:DNA-directed RNA polymerase subunit RPC12/RpoP
VKNIQCPECKNEMNPGKVFPYIEGMMFWLGENEGNLPETVMVIPRMLSNKQGSAPGYRCVKCQKITFFPGKNINSAKNLPTPKCEECNQPTERGCIYPSDGSQTGQGTIIGPLYWFDWRDEKEEKIRLGDSIEVKYTILNGRKDNKKPLTGTLNFPKTPAGRGLRCKKCGAVVFHYK